MVVMVVVALAAVVTVAAAATSVMTGEMAGVRVATHASFPMKEEEVVVAVGMIAEATDMIGMTDMVAMIGIEGATRISTKRHLPVAQI